MRFIDIGANLTDVMYQGVYNGASRHPPDLQAVLARGRECGVDKMMVTGGSLDDSKKAVQLAKEHSDLFSTVGCHPTRCSEFLPDPEGYYTSLLSLIEENREAVVAVGEFGLDYERTQFCDKETQLKFFEKQLDLGEVTGLPLFLHCRAAATDLIGILRQHRSRLTGGVVHSFDGSADERDEILALGFYIGINGCSLKTEENLSVVKGIPADKLMVETDCPWCEIRPSHAGHKLIKTKFEEYPAVDKKKWKEGATVKSRNEPHTIRQVLEIIAAVQGVDLEQLAEQVYSNTAALFFP